MAVAAPASERLKKRETGRARMEREWREMEEDGGDWSRMEIFRQGSPVCSPA